MAKRGSNKLRITFQFDYESELERKIIEALEEQYPQGINQAAKDIVTTYVFQGLAHPGCNPEVAQTHYVSGVSEISEPGYVQFSEPNYEATSGQTDSSGWLDTDSLDEMPTIEGAEPVSGLAPMTINFDG